MIADGPSANRPPHILLEFTSLLSSRSLKLAVLGFTLFAGGCDRESGTDAQPQASSGAAELSGTIDRSHKGSQMPEFTFSDPAGKVLQLTSLKGKPLLINLWATWCGPCVAELPMLDRLAGSGSIKVLTVSQDMAEPQKIAAFLTARGLKNLEPWLDPENQLNFHYNTGILPTSVYYGADGREVWRFVGAHDWNSAETTKMLAEAAPR